ncbi:hypothetical protein [Burkholderia gladioli]|uniref:hypothetical protein n=1 Tax=Burkholderia gladioli TaxID=28095 RepID=UPI0016417580|nr:hypothetical protein [Burkholderia gladioli]
MSTPHAVANQAPRGRPPRTAVAMPYFTSQDPALMRALSNRDPLGFLPIWSAFARRLVPNVASPVGQINGIRAVLLILWLSNQREIEAALFKGKDARRHFFRLMEGLIEYWLMSSGRAYCYGANTLNASGDAFALTIQSGKTVANGLYQYYRGTCRRAGFVDNDWLVSGEIGAALQAQWSPAATRALIAALDAPLADSRVPLVPARHLDGSKLAQALERVFAPDMLLDLFRTRLFGEPAQRALAKRFATLQAGTDAMSFHQIIEALKSEPPPGLEVSKPQLDREVQCVLDCEPFLIVMQDVFDVLRALGGRELGAVAGTLAAWMDDMARRARAFGKLDGELDTERMRQLQRLAATLAVGGAQANAAMRRDALVAFLRELVEFHQRCMAERGRDPLVMIEGTRLVTLVPGDRDPQEAHERLESGTPWINDYYFRTTSRLYGQVFGDGR